MSVPAVFESVIVNQFLKIPLWARIVTYFICLLVAVYQVVFPKFIDGEVREFIGNNFDGDFVAFRDTNIGTKFHGRIISTDTSNQGHWSLPLLDTAFTGDIDLRISYPDSSGDRLNTSITIPRKIALMENVIIGYNSKTPQKFKLLNEIGGDAAAPDDRVGTPIGFLTLISGAYAQEKYEEQYVPVEIEIDSIVKTLRSSSANSGNLSYGEKKEIRGVIETKYNIRLNSIDIRQSKSVEDLSKIAVTKIIAKDSVNQYAYYGNFNRSGNWADRYFKILSSESNRTPQPDDIVEAISTVNIRAGYIEYSFLKGWENKPVIGTVNPGNKYLIEEVKRIAGDYIWVKLHHIENGE